MTPTSPAPGQGLRLPSLRLRPMPPGPPGPLRPQYPMGADGHGSAGLPEISEDRVPRSVLSTRACSGPTALLVRLHRTLESFELTLNGCNQRQFSNVWWINKSLGAAVCGSSAKTKPCVLVPCDQSQSLSHQRRLHTSGTSDTGRGQALSIPSELQTIRL